MVAINYAKDIRVGEQPVKAAALGSNFVWPPLPDRLFFRGQSLVYDFARQRYGVRLPDNTIVYTTNVNDLGIVTRASAATYWGPEGSLLEAAVDEARIQHDPVTGKALGLLVESEATNSLTPNSGQLPVPNAQSFSYIDPRFPDPATRVVGALDVVAGGSPNTFYHFGSEYPGGTDDTDKASYVYVKSGVCRYFCMDASTALTSSARFIDFDNLAFSDVVEDAGFGWIKVKMFYQEGGGNTGGRRVRFWFGNELEGNTIRMRPGDECVFIYPSMFADQGESAVNSSIIPTTDSPVTRAADNAVIDLSDVLNPDEGTLRITAQVPEGGVVASLGDRHVISDSSEFKEYDLDYLFHTGNTVAQLGVGIFNKVEYSPAKQGETALENLILTLYGNGEQGAMYIPVPKVLGQQVLYQDAAGTVPVVSDGDPVGLMLDLSGNDNHGTQETSAARPIYRTDGTLHWLESDGADDFLSVQSVDMTHTNQQVISAGLRKEGEDGTFRALIETARNVNSTRGVLISAPSGDSAANYRIRVNAGVGAENISTLAGTFSGVTTNVLTGVHAPGVVGTRMSVDGQEVNSGLAADNNGNFGSEAWTIGSRLGTSAFFLGRIYGLVVVDSYVESHVAQVEQFLANKSGVLLP